MKKSLTVAAFLAISAVTVLAAGYDDIRTLGYEGEKFYRLGDPRSAAVKWEKGLELSRKTRNEKLVSYFLANLGAVYSDLGDYKKAINAGEETLPLVKKLGDKKAIASVTGNLGNIYQGIGECRKAIEYYTETIELFKGISDKQGMATALANLGKVYAECGDFTRAISSFDGAFSIMRDIRDRDGLGTVLGNLGIVYKSLGQYHKAVEYYEESLKIFKENKNECGIAVTMTNLGVVAENLGDYEKAISNFEKSLEMSKLRGDNNGIANNLSNLGTVYKDLGDYEKAITFFERALDIARKSGSRPELTENYMRLGEVHRAMDDYPRAVSYYKEGLKLFENMDYQPGVAQSLSYLGLTYADEGEFEEALECSQEALAIKKDIGLPVEEAEAAIADIYFLSGRIALAEREYSRLGYTIKLGQTNLAQKKYKEAGGYFLKALKDDEINREAKYLFAEYCGLGHSYFGINGYPEAAGYYNKAIELTENQRETLGKGEKSHFFGVRVEGFLRSEPYEGMVKTQVALKDPENAFYYSENLKARVLAEAIVRGQSASKKLAPELAEKEQVFIIRVRALRKEMETLYRNKMTELYRGREKELEKLKNDYDNFVDKLRRSNPEYAAVHYPKPIKPSEVKLSPDEVLLEFEVTDDRTYLFIMNGKGRSVMVKTIPIRRKALQELVIKYRKYFENIQKNSDLASFETAPGKELCGALFGDLVNDLPRDARLVIVPDEILGILSFESLVVKSQTPQKRGEGKYGPFPLGVEYLGDRFYITYAQSAASLTLLRSLKEDWKMKPSIVAVCDPVFSESDPRYKPEIKNGGSLKSEIQKMGAINKWKTMGVAGVKEKGQVLGAPQLAEIFPRLEKTLEIAENAEKLFKDNSLVLTGLNAREEDVVKLPFNKYSYVVFGTHGILDDTVPWIRQPALVLSLVNNSEGFDGFLTMNEVMDLKIPAEVVALTACETGVGKNVSGEGVMGLGRAFQFAGCRNVLMSLWSSAEDGTVALVNAFFENIKNGKTPPEALRAARETVRRNGFEHPFYWSAFILVSR